MEKATLYILNEVYLGVKQGQYLQVLVDRNKGGALHPHPMILESDNLRVATVADFEKFPLSGIEYYSYEEDKKMQIVVKTECGEKIARNIKYISDVKKQNYLDACLGSTTKNSKGEYVKIVAIEFNDN